MIALDPHLRTSRANASRERPRARAAVGRFAAAVVLAAISPAGVFSQEAAEMDAATGPALTVRVDIVVEDARGRALAGLRAGEVRLTQDGQTEQVSTLRARSQPGHYEVTYAPASGSAGALTIEVLRPGARVRGPEGAFLRPVAIPAASPLAVELEDLLLARPDTDDLSVSVGMLRFEQRSDTLHHTLAVEVPLSALRLAGEGELQRGRLQALARLDDEDGRLLQRFLLDQPLEGQPRLLEPQRLVWTENMHLRAGRYQVRLVVRDATASRSSSRTIDLDVPAAAAGLRISDVSLLQPSTPFFMSGGGTDDPFVLDGAKLMPTLGLTLPVGVEAWAHFFLTLYPDPTEAVPVALGLEVLREGVPVGSVPIRLPPPQASGEIRFAGAMPTRTFRDARYTLRFVATQGEAVADAQAIVRMSSEPQVPRLLFHEGR